MTNPNYGKYKAEIEHAQYKLQKYLESLDKEGQDYHLLRQDALKEFQREMHDIQTDIEREMQDEQRYKKRLEMEFFFEENQED